MFFFPIGDDNTQRQTTPLVNYTLIAINVAVYLYQIANPEFTLGYSVVPAEITSGHDIIGQVRGVPPDGPLVDAQPLGQRGDAERAARLQDLQQREHPRGGSAQSHLQIRADPVRYRG